MVFSAQTMQLLYEIGKGSYAKVYYGKLKDLEVNKDSPNPNRYAVKVFRNEVKYETSTNNEIIINEFLMEKITKEKSDNIIKTFGSYFYRTKHLVCEYLDINLYNFTKFYKEDVTINFANNIFIQITNR